MLMEPKPEHDAFMAELKSCLGSTGKDLDAAVLLAISSQFVGQLLALQDQRRYSVEQAIDLVMRNLEIGNQMVINSHLTRPEGSA